MNIITSDTPMSIDYREQYDDLLLDWENDVETSPSLRDTPWDQWTNEQKDIMWAHVEYYKDKIAEITTCWASGPIPKSQVSQPKTDLSFIYTEKESGKKETNDNKEFLNYLKSKCYADDHTTEHLSEMPTDNLNSLEQYLRIRFAKLNRSENTLLLDHISFGNDLAKAKRLFKSLKKRHNKITWELWISVNVKICKSYANKHIAMYHLVSEYPKLKKLAISFKELYTISHRIRTIFAKNNAEALHWK